VGVNHAAQAPSATEKSCETCCLASALRRRQSGLFLVVRYFWSGTAWAMVAALLAITSSLATVPTVADLRLALESAVGMM